MRSLVPKPGMVTAETVCSLHTDEERESAVQAARDAHHDILRAGVLPAAHEPVGLDGEDVEAIVVLVGFLRQERRHGEDAVERLGEVVIALDGGDVDFAIVPDFVRGIVGVALALGAQTLDVYLLYYHVGDGLETLADAEHRAVLGDVGGAGEDDVGGTLAHPGGSIDIAAMHARGLLGDHLAAELVLADKAVGGREVENEFGTLNRQLGGRREGAPQVFAYLDAEAETAGSEQQISTERNIAAP